MADQNQTSDRWADWRRAVSEADNGTLIEIRDREATEAARYQENADYHRWRADVITDELELRHAE